jgi:hypothetical protein
MKAQKNKLFNLVSHAVMLVAHGQWGNVQFGVMSSLHAFSTSA